MTNGDASETVSRRGFLTAVTGAAATAGAGAAAAEGDGATTTTAGAATTTQGGTTTDGGTTSAPTTTTGGDGTTTAGEGTTTGGDGTTTAGEGTTTGGDGTTTGSGGGGAAAGPTEEVIVGPGGSLVFEPADLTITPGTTVNFVWESDNHNVVPESIPDGAEWSGTEGAPSATYNTGYEYSHTFETKGEYAYFCQPHKGAGMEATITVEEASAGAAGGPPAFPDSALTFGVTSIGVMLSTLALAYFFIKYGGDYETPE
jgi:plastocyanin